MKKSVMKGKDQRKNEEYIGQLQLLGSIGMDLKESIIQEESGQDIN